MAGQFQIAHSQIVVGAAIIAGGPYGCAESTFSDNMPGPGTAFFNLSKAVNGCMLNALEAWGVPDPEQLAKRTKQLAEQGRIDPIDGIIRDRIYLFSGTNDHTVVPSIVAAAVKFYRSIGVPDANIKLVADLAAGHAFITDAETANACERSVVPTSSVATTTRRAICSRTSTARSTPHAATASGDYIVFDQRAFTKDLGDSGLRTWASPTCPLRARQRRLPRPHRLSRLRPEPRGGRRRLRSRRPASPAGPTPTALIILFPQTPATPLNPQACWDWWGYTGREYLTRKAPQIVAVYRMLERLAGGP